MEIMSQMIRTWCDALLRLQVTEIKMKGIYGGILCPACSRIHGRCAEAIYPLTYLADRQKEEKYLNVAMLLFDWWDHVSCSDGSWLNETDSEWKGTTVFGALSLGESIKFHGAILEDNILTKWKERLYKASEYLYRNINITTANINYPITCSSALLIAGEVLEEKRYCSRAQELAYESLEYFTENKILYGEGNPKEGITKRGNRPVDLGYNVEESLPAFVIYGITAGDCEILDFAAKALEEHLEFMLPDGGWDNSWGTRNYKWTYWGSRTTDGCQAAYSLLSARNPVFGEAAHRNMLLLQKCTHEGILYGGPHLYIRDEPPCIHHTFCHAKVLAAVLDRETNPAGLSTAIKLPRESSSGVREYPEISTWLISIGAWRATVTAYDWEYMRESHASGGAISMIWHERIGPVLSGSLTEYQMIEPGNMQIPRHNRNMCLTPRIELLCDNTYYRSINDSDAKIRYTQDKDRIEFFIEGKLVDKNQGSPSKGEISFEMQYIFKHHYVEIEIYANASGNCGNIVYHLPVISEHYEKVSRVKNDGVSIEKSSGYLSIETDTVLNIFGESEDERIFNLVPGLEAVPFYVCLLPDHRTKILIRYLEAK